MSSVSVPYIHLSISKLLPTFINRDVGAQVIRCPAVVSRQLVDLSSSVHPLSCYGNGGFHGVQTESVLAGVLKLMY